MLSLKREYYLSKENTISQKRILSLKREYYLREYYLSKISENTISQKKNNDYSRISSRALRNCNRNSQSQLAAKYDLIVCVRARVCACVCVCMCKLND